MYKGQKDGIYWKLDIFRAAADQKFQVLSNSIRLQHTETGSYLSCQISKDLPEQFEVSASKDRMEDSNFWTVESHLNRYCKTPFFPYILASVAWFKEDSRLFVA